jgi:hypothetical protein
MNYDIKFSSGSNLQKKKKKEQNLTSRSRAKLLSFMN